MKTGISAAGLMEKIILRLKDAMQHGARPSDIRDGLRIMTNDEDFWGEVLRDQRLIERKIATGRTTKEKELQEVERVAAKHRRKAARP